MPRFPPQVDAIFKAAALAANSARIPLAKMAVAETRMGCVEDKVRAAGAFSVLAYVRGVLRKGVLFPLEFQLLLL